jgi:hypothetical protein
MLAVGQYILKVPLQLLCQIMFSLGALGHGTNRAGEIFAGIDMDKALHFALKFIVDHIFQSMNFLFCLQDIVVPW